MKNDKFELTKETKYWFGTTLYRIKALKAFGSVEKGELGGFIEKEANIESAGNAWVFDNARVFDNAQVSGNARVFGHAQVSGNAFVYGKLKLEAGLFFGIKWSSDTEIKQIEIDNGNFLVYKGEAIFGSDEPKIDDATENAIKLLKENGYRIIKSN